VNKLAQLSATLLCVCSWLSNSQNLWAEGLPTGAEAQVTVAASGGGQPYVGKPIDLALEFRDPATGEARSVEKLLAWVRPKRKNNADCRDAAQMARAMLGQLSQDVIALDRTLYVQRSLDKQQTSRRKIARNSR
jgi:hypothetical protein